MKHIVIIGGGVIGLSAAAELATRGHKVTVLEREPAARNGCSFGNAGMVVPSHFIPLAAPGMVQLGMKWMWNPESPFYIKPRLNWDLFSWAFQFWRACTPQHVAAAAPLLRDLNLASRELYQTWAERGTDIGLEQKGLLMLCKTAHTLDEEATTAEKACKLGVPAQVLDAKQAAVLDPTITMDIHGAVYFPKDCHLRPERYVAALEETLRANGGEIIFQCELQRWILQGSRVTAVQTSQGEFAADQFVLATGSWSPTLLNGLRLKLPMQAGKGYSVTVPNPVERPAICSILTEARVAVTPMGQGVRFGGTMEIAGLNEQINPRRVAGILKAVPKYFPKFKPQDFQDLPPWRGLRPCSPDGLPYLGKTSAASNLIVATGHAMMGLSLAPVTGEIVADLAEDKPSRFDLKMLRPDRY